MIFIGDTHGKTARLTSIVEKLSSDKKKFQLGDMGLGFSGVTLPQLNNFQFIRGNHDSPEQCQAHPNYAGEFGYLEDAGVFFLGGAWSIDWQYRREGISWWSNEEQSPEALAQALKLYAKVKPRIVATHETSSEAAKALLNAALIGNPGGEQSYFMAKFGRVETRTSKALQQMFEAHQPEHWVFGHYHFTKDFELNGTQFHCLAELEMKELT